MIWRPCARGFSRSGVQTLAVAPCPAMKTSGLPVTAPQPLEPKAGAWQHCPDSCSPGHSKRACSKAPVARLQPAAVIFRNPNFGSASSFPSSGLSQMTMLELSGHNSMVRYISSPSAACRALSLQDITGFCKQGAKLEVGVFHSASCDVLALAQETYLRVRLIKLRQDEALALCQPCSCISRPCKLPS